ncbi:MAG: DUF2490 domain-containing protein [Flavobacteriales bacterium]|nr:DUF2490 domain-containing protein [Flavobacteriales bacterium]
MKHLALLAFIFVGLSAYSQHEFQVWTELGTSGKLVKRTKWSVDINSRFGNNGLETFFPQFGVEYKVKKWFRPSIDYRFILDKDDYGNMISGHRINFNANVEESVDRFEIDGRLRYQYAFNRLGNSTDFDPDLDQAFRLKGSVKYDINNSLFTPLFSAELFYAPEYGPDRGFSKIRIAMGTSLELDGPHKFSAKYQLDKRFEYGRDLRHVISLSYGYKL